MKKHIILSMFVLLTLTGCNEFSIIEGISSQVLTKLSVGSFITPPPFYNNSIKHTLYLKSDLNVGKLDVTYTLNGYNITQNSTITKYYPTGLTTCQQTTESSVILDLRTIVATNPNIANINLPLNIIAKAENGQTFNKTVNVKVNFCYSYYIEEFELK